MKLHPKRAVAAVGAVAIAAGVTLATAGTAFAAAPYNPDSGSLGSITFTDANGVPVTSGSTTVPIAAYAAGSKLINAGDTDASLNVYLPAFGQPTALWSGEAVGLDTVFSPAPAAYPTDLKGLVTAGKPVINERSTDLSPASFAADFPNTSTTGPNTAQPTWQNLYQLRLFTGSTTATYDSADILISGTTWTLVPNPDQTVATTTTISASPASPISSSNPLPVTLTTTVTPAGSVASGYIGGIGTVVVKDGATVIDTKIVAPGSSAPFTVTTGPINETNPSNHSFTATFTPFNGTGLLASASTALVYNISVPLPTATTTLAATWQPFAGGSTPTHFSGTVTGNGTTPPPVTAGTVNLFDNGSSTPLNPTPLVVGAGGAFSSDIIIATSGPHSVVATFTDAGVYLPSSSSPVTQTLGADPGALCTSSPATGAGSCTDQQTITGTVPAGTLTVSTPYTTAHPFNVGTLALDTSGTFLTTHAVFGGAGLVASDPNADIIVTDTRAGDLNWTLQAQSSNLTDATADIINSQNVGLTGLGSHPAPGFNTAGLVGFNNAAATGVAPAAAGNLGLGGAIKHDVAQATAGIGTVGIYGTLTLNAPTSTTAGIYVGTITFTIVGSLV
ncbi:MAG TPA: hypothetical protein VGD55_04510 [Acidothermaceae bacterium]